MIQVHETESKDSRKIGKIPPKVFWRFLTIALVVLIVWMVVYRLVFKV